MPAQEPVVTLDDVHRYVPPGLLAQVAAGHLDHVLTAARDYARTYGVNRRTPSSIIFVCKRVQKLLEEQAATTRRVP